MILSIILLNLLMFALFPVRSFITNKISNEMPINKNDSVRIINDCTNLVLRVFKNCFIYNIYE